MSDEENKELEQQNNQEQKEDNKEQAKRDIKLVITSVVATLIFIIILLLLVLLGLKKCSNKNDVISSSSEPSSNEPMYHYDNVKLNDKFKHIVNAYRENVMVELPDALTTINSVTYIDNYETGKFSLSIVGTSINNKVYYYQAKDTFYPNDKSKFNNLIEYLLLDETPDIFNEGDASTEYSCHTASKAEEVITIDKTSYQYVISISDTSNKYFDGFYFENNQYYIYQHQELTLDPFKGVPNQVLGLDNPLYGYYQSLNQ